MKGEILKLLARNARYTTEEISTLLDVEVDKIEEAIAQLEKDGLIRGYKAVIDWEKTDDAYVSALVELNVVPKAGLGFEEIAERVMKCPQVESVYLMSGAYDLNVLVKGRTLRDIALFVSRELATMESVTSTATHFIMRRYKDMDVELVSDKDDDRGQIWV